MDRGFHVIGGRLVDVNRRVGRDRSAQIGAYHARHLNRFDQACVFQPAGQIERRRERTDQPAELLVPPGVDLAHLPDRLIGVALVQRRRADQIGERVRVGGDAALDSGHVQPLHASRQFRHEKGAGFQRLEESLFVDTHRVHHTTTVACFRRAISSGSSRPFLHARLATTYAVTDRHGTAAPVNFRR